MQGQQVDEGSITPVELQAELNTLRSLRRRSISQPSEGIDPDLPPSPSKYGHGNHPTSPKQLHHVFGPSDAAPPQAGPSSSSSNSSPSRTPGISLPSSDIAEEDEGTEDQPLADNLSELFWLPARLHPEIAPQEFRSFIRDQTKPENLLRRSGSQLGRRKSMLSRQYQPSDTETESASMSTSDAESTPSTSPSISRRPSRVGSFRRSTGLDRLTLADLQKLETIARQAAEEGQTGEEGEAQLKRLVRRSLSLNPAAILGVADQLQDDDSFVEDDTDSPLIVPPPGSILRRSARTKIRKNSLLGDGGGHRFGPSRRTTRLSDSSDASGLTASKRQASISSLHSLEHDSTVAEDGRPTSADMGQGSPRTPGSSTKAEYPAEPLPMQYLPPTGVMLAERMEAADLGPQDGRSMSVSPGRAGADMPLFDHAASDALQWTTGRKSPDDGNGRAGGPTAGSLRTTRKIGAQAQASPEIQLRSPSTAASVQGPPLSDRLHFPPSSEASTSHLFDAPEAPKTESGDTPDSRPAVPGKPSRDTRSVELQASAPITEGVRMISDPPQVTNKTGVQHEKVNANIDRQPVQIPNRTSASPGARPGVVTKEKEKKSTWAKLGLSRSTKEEGDLDDGASIASTSSGSSTFGRKGKKTKKDKVSNEISPEKKVTANQMPNEKNEKQDGASSFFVGLFGKKRADQNDQSKKDTTLPTPPLQMPTPPPTASGMLTPDGKYINFYRLPIHIERAVYRLSHIKLANPRRPLYEQVLISNLMFWYLGVINKPVVPSTQMQQRPAPQQAPLINASSSQLLGSNKPPRDPSPGTANPSPRPPLLRENSSQSGKLTPVVAGQAVPERRDAATTATNSSNTLTESPASHPPSIISPTMESGEIDVNLRLAPQMTTLDVASPEQQHSRSPPKQATQSYRYQDYIDTSDPSDRSTPRDQIVPPQGNPPTMSPSVSEGEWPNWSTRKERRSSAESNKAEDVQYDSRRITADLDTFDIISAYADEERRKSTLAEQIATGQGQDATSLSSPNPASTHRNGHAPQSPENSPRSGLPKSAHRTTPPRQSSITTAAPSKASQQHAIALHNPS